METKQVTAILASTLNKDLLSLAQDLCHDQFLESLVNILLRHLGPGRCLVFIRTANKWKPAVDGQSSNDTVLLNKKHKNSEAIHSLVNRVASSGKPLLQPPGKGKSLSDNADTTCFCTPLNHLGDTVAVLYMELPSVLPFPPRLLILEHLCKTLPSLFANHLAHKELKRQVQHLAQQVNEIRRNKQQVINAEKLSSLGRLSASIAHEFGNPLLGIKFLLTDLAKSDSLSAHRKDMIKIGLEECNRLQAMIRKLRHEQQPAQDFFVPTPLVSLLKQVLAKHEHLLTAHNISLQTDFTETDPLVMCIQRQLFLVADNLILNAVEALQGATAPYVLISTGINRDNVFFTVSDNGRGMDEAASRKTFEPFYSTKPDIEGAGLGLSVAYWIVSGHNGTIVVDSKPDKGTSFTVTLPRMLDEWATEDPLQENSLD